MPRPASVTATRAERTRSLVLETAETPFAEGGGQETRLEDVARDGGIRRRYAQAIIPPASHHHRLERLCGDLARISHLLLGAPRGRSVERAAS